MYHNSIAGALGKLSDGMAVLIMVVGVDTNNVLFWEEIDKAEGLVLDILAWILFPLMLAFPPFFLKPSKEKIFRKKKTKHDGGKELSNLMHGGEWRYRLMRE